MEQGRVTVNGELVREPGTKADPATDDIRVDGVRVKASVTPVYIVLHKPRGVVTTRRDPAGRQTVMDLVPGVAGLFPVGRLDVTTEGLILLTNDGAFAERVAHPRYEVPRVYHAKVHRAPDARALERLQRGIRIDGEMLKADRVRVLDSGNNPWLELTLHEGKQHEVRRLLEAVGHPVSKLRRVAIGPVLLRGLETGEFRALRPEEVAGLLRGEGAPPTPVRLPRRGRPSHKRVGAQAAIEEKGRAAGRGDRFARSRGSSEGGSVEPGHRRGVGRGQARGHAKGARRGSSVPPWAPGRETTTGARSRRETETAGRTRSQQDWAEGKSRKVGRGGGGSVGRSGESSTSGRDRQDRVERGSQKSGRGRAGSTGRSAAATGGRGQQEWAERGGQKGGRGRGGSAGLSGASTAGGQGRTRRPGTGSRGRRR